MRLAEIPAPRVLAPSPTVDTRPLAPTRAGTLALSTKSPDGHPHVSAASGIAVAGGVAWVVSDTFGELARFESLAGKGALLPGLAPAKKKPDLESLLRIPGAAGGSLLLSFGSGSKAKGTSDRGLVQTVDTAGRAAGAPIEVSLTPLYDELRTRLPMGVNVEGLALRDTARGRELLVVHRGRLEGDVNTIFRLDGDRAIAALAAGRAPSADLVLGAHSIELGRLHGSRLGFADTRALDDGRIAFVASAEGPGEPDGALIGSAVGILDANFAVQVLRPLDGPPRKVEGIEPSRSFDTTASATQFTLVTDPDDPTIAAEVLTVDLG